MNRSTKSTYSGSPSYRRARSTIVKALVGSFILAAIAVAVIAAALGFVFLGSVLFVLSFVLYIVANVLLEV